MRAANIFGPALMKCSFNARRFAKLLETIVNTLYFELLLALSKKSTSNELMITKLEVNAKAIKNNTVNKPLKRAIVSLIF